MRERVSHSIGKEQSKGLTISTFHTLGFEILKREHKLLGFKSGMTLFDEHDQIALLKHLLPENAVEDKDLIKALISTISNWKIIYFRLKWRYITAERSEIAFFRAFISFIKIS